MLIAQFLHLLGLTIWVGGMFFAHMALRPALSVLQPEQRLRLMAATLANFFIWVWIAIALVLGTGLHMTALMAAGGPPPHYVSAMSVIGIVMMLIFGHIFFAPFRRLKSAVSIQDWDTASRGLRQIRLLVGVNLCLGLLTIAIGALGPLAG